MWFLTARSLPSSGEDGTVAQETTGEQHSLSLHMETFTHTLQAEGTSAIVPDQTPGVKESTQEAAGSWEGFSRKPGFGFCPGLQDCTVQDPEETPTVCAKTQRGVEHGWGAYNQLQEPGVLTGWEAGKAGRWGPCALSRHDGYFLIPKPQHTAVICVCLRT